MKSQAVPSPAATARTTVYQPWGRLQPPAGRVRDLGSPPDLSPGGGDGTLLPFGNGRSYGDACMNSAGVLLGTRAHRGVLAFDEVAGTLRAEAGILLSEILDAIVPKGWFLPVTPGTQFVTLGGAVANDVHGKNHHVAGTFGCHVTALELARSDGSRVECSRTENPELFAATIGGLGLTGVILWCEIGLKPIAGRGIHVESRRFGGLDEFFALSRELSGSFEYTVSWIDCLAGGPGLGRGWFMAGTHAPPGEQRAFKPSRGVNFFVQPPISMVNSATLRAFNLVYYHRPVPRTRVTDYVPFFYPLDAVRNWNRMYGPRGFFQFQCVLPPATGEAGIRDILLETAKRREGSFLVVLKEFGDVATPGLLSFPRPGPTQARDLPNRGEKTARLLRHLEAMVMEAGGALYPAKDALMSPDTFRRSYPRWEALERLRDPAMNSDFWSRVTTGLR
ncbi:MAG TPA: FAD-binding oxidoreductase [Longimicrobiales bacterium]|nr:FAD-binding oxidoreductase [Longimicrobiales bacterium]